jgi:tetratricopeptide (TPR) repeat protein
MGTSARIDELRKKFDENPRRYFAPLANEYRKAGDLEQAIFICQEYLPQQPGHMSGHIVYGQALYESGREEEAKAVFETALSLDPENLIALKHLGDIARASGDAAGARNWYQRVLDADPRNDEIIVLISSLAPSSDAQATSSPRERFTPLSNAVIETAPDSDASSDNSFVYASERSEIEQSEIEKSEDALLPSEFEMGSGEEAAISVGGPEQTDVPPLPPSHPAPAATTTDDGLLDLDDFSLSGVPVGATTPDEPVATPSPIGLDGDVNISGGFTFGADDVSLEAESFAETAPTPSPDIELATDINLGLIQGAESANTAGDELPSLAGLETFEAGVIAASPVDVPVLETEAFFDLPPIDDNAPGASPAVGASSELTSEESLAESDAEPAMETFSFADESAPIDGGHDGLDVPESVTDGEPADHEAPPSQVAAAMDAGDQPKEEHREESAAEPEEAFVTETMAELYIQQGHLDSALDIYRRLVEQRPNEPDLRDRLRAIEDRLFGPPAAAAAEDEDSPSPSGPTIREFLIALVSRRPSNGGSSQMRASQETTPEETALEETAPEFSNRGSRMTPSASETVTGSIDALFSGAHKMVSDADLDAASALAAAFATTPEPEGHRPTPLPGTPAHRAPDELSLDHVFKPNTPPRDTSASNAFSFDQFFADEMTDAGAEPSREPAPGSPEATDDIAQFNAWLNGLKKT